MPRPVQLLILAIVLFWIIDSPRTAAGTVTNILDLLAYGAGQVVEFVRAVV